MGLESELKTVAQSVQLINVIFVPDSKKFVKPELRRQLSQASR